MSHIVTIETQVRDAQAVTAACVRLRWALPHVGTHRIFSQQVGGLAVQPPRWRYPIVCELSTGKLHYDNYGGAWGDPAEVDRFRQSYAIEKATLEARKLGRTVVERPLTDGTVKLTISAGEGL